jgi:hypothetical protein
MNKLDYSSPYEIGWQSGYNDEEPDCPYESGTEDAKEWQEGYDDGSWDS